MLKFIQNFLVLSLTFLVTSGIIEVGLRYFMPIDYRPPPSELAYVGRETIYQASTIPNLDYDLKPNVAGTAQNVPVKTNSYGMRDDEPLPGDRERIVVIGDSFAFGFGVPQDDLFPLLLEQKLNSVADKYDVLNLTVPGYNVQDEVNILKARGLLWQPKTIIIAYVLNDPETEPVQELPSYFDEPQWWQYSHLLRLVARGLKRIQINLDGGGDYYKYLHANKTTWQSVVGGFQAIQAMAAEDKSQVILVIFPILGDDWSAYPYLDLHRQVATLGKKNGFLVIDLYNYATKYPPQDLRVSIQDGHPNALFHAITADAIFENLPH
jgi:hypothetical protein